MGGWRCRVRKLPKQRISILSPVWRLFTMLSKIVSTMISESLRVISTTLETSSISSALVIILPCQPLLLLILRMPLNYVAHGRCGYGGLTLIVLQPHALFLVGHRFHAEANSFLRLIHLYDLESEFFADGQQ